MRRLDHVAGSRFGAWFFRKVGNRLDRVLLPLTRGRVRTSFNKPTGLLHTTGAKSGEPRVAPVLFLRDGENVVLIASNGGTPTNPGWYHNLRANPHCAMEIRGRKREYLAREAAGEERARLWQLGVDTYEGWLDYEARTDRVIPVLVLEPVSD